MHHQFQQQQHTTAIVIIKQTHTYIHTRQQCQTVIVQQPYNRGRRACRFVVVNWKLPKITPHQIRNFRFHRVPRTFTCTTIVPATHRAIVWIRRTFGVRRVQTILICIQLRWHHWTLLRRQHTRAMHHYHRVCQIPHIATRSDRIVDRLNSVRYQKKNPFPPSHTTKNHLLANSNLPHQIMRMFAT